MAMSGTIPGTRDGNKPYLNIDWSILEQDIPNNRSKLRATLKLYAPQRINYTTSKKGVFQNTGFTHRRASGTGVWDLRTIEFWVSHDSNGTRNVTMSATFNINITFSGSWIGQLSVSGIAWLDSIPRASRLKSFSIKSEFRPDTSNAVLLEIERYYSGYAHEVVLKYGDYQVRAWGSIHLPTEITIPSADVNNLLKEMKSVNSGSFTLHINTKDYNQTPTTNIGTSERLTARQSIDGSYIPTISNFTDENTGTPLVKSIGYIQELSGVKTSFTPTPSYGADIRSVRLWLVNPDGDTVGEVSESGTTFSTLSKAGEYRLNCYAVDTRGRVGSQSRWFTVKTYNPPTIRGFLVERQEEVPTNLDILISGAWSIFGTKNKLTVKVDYQKIKGTTWNNLISTSYSTSPDGTFNISDFYTGFLETNTYDLRLTLADSFGNEIIGELNIGTSKVLLDFHEDLGVGIGKWHEQGDLDVLKEIFINNAEVVASGKNSNGIWIKFYSGVMVCIKNIYLTDISIYSDVGKVYTSDYISGGAWAKDFKEIPYRIVDLVDAGGGYGFWLGTTPSANTSQNSAGRILVNYNRTFTIPYANVLFMGVGLWR